MKSNYERKRYGNRYWLVTAVILVLDIIISIWLLEGQAWKVILSAGLVLVLAFLLYLLSKKEIDSVYSEVENVSEIMENLLDGDGEPPSEEYKEGTIGILYTNFYKLVKSLQESRDKELDEKIFLRDIISDISHQLKTPLASLMVFMDLLLDDKLEDEAKKKQVLNESKNQLNRMEWMVLSMLKLARIEAGSISFECNRKPLLPLLKQAEEGVSVMLADRNQILNIECDEDFALDCDGGWLCEAMINLLKNASDYSDEGKHIWISTEQTNVYTRIYVRDEGMGIAEEELPNIFTRFYRVHNEVNPNSVGIGLSLTKSIVEGMGGHISVNSKEGKGTCFTVTFVK